MLRKVHNTLEQDIKTVILMFLFLCSVDVFNRHRICIVAMCVFFVIAPNRKLCLDYNFILLFVFSITLVIFDPFFNDRLTNIIGAFNFPLCYLLGRCLFITDEQSALENEEKKVRTITYIVGIGTFIHYFLNMLVNLGRTDRDVIEFWSREELSATGQAAYASIIIGIIAATIFSPKLAKFKKIMAVVALVVVVSYNLILSGRTIFILIVVAMLVAYYYKNRAQKKSVLVTIIGIVAIVAVLVLLYNANVFNVKTIFENSNFYNRFYGGEITQDIDEDSRMDYKLYYIKHLQDSFFGGGHIRAEYGHSAHDLYLDTYDEAGIFAVLLIIVYIFASLLRVYKCMKNKNISLYTKLLVLCIYTTVNIMFFIEPILRGASWLLFSYCIIDGAVAYLLQYVNKEHKVV